MRTQTTKAKLKVMDKQKPILIHPEVCQMFLAITTICGWTEEEIRKETIHSIRAHFEKAPEFPSYKGSCQKFHVLTLSNIDFEVIYTVASRAIIVRGYSWDTGVPFNEFDGGGYYAIGRWHKLR